MKDKITYSKNEKIVRAVCYLGILISFIIGILLLFISKLVGGIIVLVISATGIFLINSFVIIKVKAFINNKPKKKLLLAIFYITVILIVMTTAFIVSTKTSLPYEAIIDKAITYTSEKIDNDIANSTVKSTEIFDGFIVGDSYYFALETEYELAGIGGASSVHYCVTYVKINKITGNVSETDFKSYETARTYS